jgi:hypothetical protein
MLLYRTEGLGEQCGRVTLLHCSPPPPARRGQGRNRWGRMKGGRVRGIEAEAEGAESEGKNQRE